FVQMRGFRVPGVDASELQRRLFDEHRIEVPVFETRHGAVLRVSVQGYNDEADLAALADALAEALPRAAGRLSYNSIALRGKKRSAGSAHDVDRLRLRRPLPGRAAPLPAQERGLLAQARPHAAAARAAADDRGRERQDLDGVGARRPA